MSKKIRLIGGALAYADGAAELTKELDFVLDESGIPVDAVTADHPYVKWDGKAAEIGVGAKVHFFRMFTILLDGMDGGAFEKHETAYFEKAGAMFDCSRNAVLTVPGFEGFLRKMGMMGLNLAMLYTEETYQLPEHPYFGYLRGAYSAEELKALDDYADKFGIEMIPCIQTLAHMEQYLRWAAASDLCDVGSIMLCGDEKVLEFIELCITTASAPFRSRRIHLGMDEAQGIGSGRYMKLNGYRPVIDILHDHMDKVAAICKKHGLEPMIWSDMWLRPLSPTDDYYDFSGNAQPITPEIAAAVPKDLNLVYWDYYHHTKEEYLTMIERHKQFGNRLVFAGGSWNWSGPIPNYGKTFDTSEKGLAACRESGIKEVFCTIWGDNGSESSLTNSLLGLQYYAENTYTDKPANEAIFDAFRRCAGGRGEDMYDLRLMEELPGVPEGNPDVATPTKYILYQDVLMGLFDKHLRVQRDTFGSVKAYYAARRDALAAAKLRNPKYECNYALYEAIADILTDKAEVGLDIHDAYAAKDKEALKKQVAVLEGLLPKYDALTLLWEKVWLSTNKPFGFDVISTRLGGTRGRIAYAIHRLNDYIEGRVDELPEVAAEQLFFDGRETDLVNGSAQLCACNWARIAAACPI